MSIFVHLIHRIFAEILFFGYTHLKDQLISLVSAS